VEKRKIRNKNWKRRERERKRFPVCFLLVGFFLILLLCGVNWREAGGSSGRSG
jgi:hypothetical protein